MINTLTASSILKGASIAFPKAIPFVNFNGALKADTFQKSTTVPSFKGNNFLTELNDLQISLAVGSKKMDNAHKIKESVDFINKTYGKEVEKIAIARDTYSPDTVFVVTANLGKKETYKEYFNENLDKIGQEKTYFQKDEKNNQVYKIVKSKDLVNNTSTKIRMNFFEGSLRDSIPDKTILIDEVKIVKDKNDKITRKDYTYQSPVKGVYNQKSVYPDGTEKFTSKLEEFSKFDGMKVIKKDMTSPDGTKSNYRYEYDDKGNRLLEYKIIDKNGKVLMDLNKTFEVVSDNKFISSNGDKSYEMTFEDEKVTIKEKGSDKITEIPYKKKICGTQEAIDIAKNVMKKMPGDELIALSKTIKSIKGVKDEAKCKMSILDKHIDTVDNLFAALHEVGHAKDFKNSKGRNFVQSLTGKKELQKIFSAESENFKKSYPTAQQEHLKYFISQNNGYSDSTLFGLGEVVAEVNALKDAHCTSEILGARGQYLQQNFPKTIAYLNQKL